MVFVYVARKEGYVEKVKELSPKYYYYSRRVKVIMGGGLLTGFAILTTLRVLYGPLPYSQFFPLFLALFVVSLGIIFVGWAINIRPCTNQRRASNNTS